MTTLIPPLALRPAAVTVHDGLLWAVPSETAVVFPIAGTWRNLAESNWTDDAQLDAVARRFGPLTEAGSTDTGEPVLLWERLIDDLKELSHAWTDTGEIADRSAVARARIAGKRIQDRLLHEHYTAGGRFEVGAGGRWALVCLGMGQWWRLSAISDLHRGDAMRRCRHCGTWFSLTGLRADAGFCSSAHRSAFHQKRSPASQFWAEVI
jgi:hypothetical protein